jgi:hypothetical protein
MKHEYTKTCGIWYTWETTVYIYILFQVEQALKSLKKLKIDSETDQHKEID